MSLQTIAYYSITLPSLTSHRMYIRSSGTSGILSSSIGEVRSMPPKAAPPPAPSGRRSELMALSDATPWLQMHGMQQDEIRRYLQATAKVEKDGKMLYLIVTIVQWPTSRDPSSD